MPSADMWKDLETVIHSEVKSEREKQILLINIFIWNRKLVQMNLLAKQKQTQRWREQTYEYSGYGGGGMNWETVTDIYTLLILCIKESSTTSENLPQHRELCQGSVVTYMGKNSTKEGPCIYILLIHSAVQYKLTQ